MDKPARHFIVSRGISYTPIPVSKWSKEGSAAWAQIVETLEMHDGFYISQKSTKDHLALLIAKRSKQKKAEEKLSGVEIEETELDIAIDEIVNDMEVCEATVSAASDTKKAEEEKEKKVAEETRKLAMESLGQTQKRARR